MSPKSVASPERSMAAIVPVVAFLAAIASFVLFAANDFDRRAIHWGRIQVFLMFVLPLVPGVFMLAWRRSRPHGIAYAAGLGTVATLALALPVGLLLIFLGVATPAQRIDALALLGYTLSMLVVAVSSWKAHRGLASGGVGPDSAMATLAGTFVYALLGWAFFNAKMGVPYDRVALIRDYNDRQARAMIAAIAQCARKFTQGSGAKGYPATMAELRAGGCLPKSLQLGQSKSGAAADGYGFYYFADPPDANGRVARFALCARTWREDSARSPSPSTRKET